MTKAVRIENADMSQYKVRVRTYEKGVNGAPDSLVNEAVLHYPTAQTEALLTSSRYTIIDELPGDTP